jgi:hypothetical protein
MTVTEVNALVDEAVAFMAASEWQSAKAKLLAASAGIATIPDRKHGDAELKFDRAAIRDLIKQVEQEARRVAGRGNGSGLQVGGIRFVGDQ